MQSPVFIPHKIDKRFAGSMQFAAQHVTVGGNAAFIPSWFSSAFASAPAAVTATPPDAAFADILAQRDPRRRVDIGAGVRPDGPRGGARGGSACRAGRPRAGGGA